MADPLADVIKKATTTWWGTAPSGVSTFEFAATAVRAAGYKSPEEIEAILDAEPLVDEQGADYPAYHAIEHLRDVLGI